MKCEVEFLPVGEGEKGGDAIVIRYGEEDAYNLMVVDGGNLDSGEQMVAHIRREFPTKYEIEHVVLTHADADHASGLRKLFGEFYIHHLWMHVPWLLAVEAKGLFKDKEISDDDLSDNVKKEYDILSELWDLAVANGTQIHHPFEGADIGPFKVLSPTRFAYLHLLPQFEKTPEPDQELLTQRNMWLGKSMVQNIFAKLFDSKLFETLTWVAESHEYETLRDGQRTSASNESSVVLYGDFGNHRILLTGDAGENALHWACDAAEQKGLALQTFTFVQIPHHGSRHNVGPTILNRLIGGIVPRGAQTTFSAFASVPKDDSKHPRKIVLNAFTRRGGRVSTTKEGKRVYWGGFAARPNYVSITPIPLSAQVEGYDD
jgi:beta-lactamase superfamily II metal-dependent hydrolase